MIATINPANNKTVKTFDEISSEELKLKIESAQQTYLKWKDTSYDHRKSLMLNVAEVLKINRQKYADILTLEMGKPISQSLAEVDKCALVCEYYANNTQQILQKEIIESDADESYVRFDPLGIVLAVMPWNFPFWQVFRFAAPALMAGNVGLLKHASNVPMSAIAIEDIFREAKFPDGCFTTLLIGSGKVNDVINHPDVMATTLTGSEIAGKNVASFSGHNLKKSVMELGGSDPFIVLEDANLDDAVDAGVKSRLINNGQSCIAAKRFIVVEEIYDEFKSKFVSKMENIRMGDPTKADTELGPMAREDLMIELHEQIKKSLELGASILCGGDPMDQPGCYFPPTVVENVKPGMPAYDEEFFGPAAILIKAENEDDAIRIANDTVFGLGSSLWTNNINKAEKFASQINSGSVFINGMVKSDPRLPFGGIKISGYGRELSHYGIKEFVNIKTVWIKK